MDMRYESKLVFWHLLKTFTVKILYFTVPQVLRDFSGTPQTPQGVLKIPANFSKSPQKVPGKAQELPEDLSRTCQKLTRTQQGLLKDFIQI
jgi:hypothetical protein